MVTCQRNPEVDNAAARDLNQASALTPIGGHVMRSGIIAITLHLLGSMILVGSLLHAQVFSLPLISNLSGSTRRLRRRVRVLARTYTQLWIGVAILFFNILYLLSWNGFRHIPPRVVAGYMLLPVLLLLLLLGQVIFLSEMEYQLGIKRFKSASRWYRPLYATLFPTLLTSFGILISPFLWPYMKTWRFFSL